MSDHYFRRHQQLQKKEREMPVGFHKTVLKTGEFLLVEFTVTGQEHRNYHFGTEPGFLIESFTLKPVITTSVPDEYRRDIDRVLPYFARFVSMDKALTKSLADHLWYVGVDLNTQQFGNRIDVTGQRFGQETKTFRWFLKGEY